MYDVLRQREFVDSEDPRQRGNYESRRASEEMIAGFHLHVQNLDRDGVPIALLSRVWLGAAAA